MPISKKMAASLGKSSLVRKMFEEGLRLKAQFGADKVYDFSIGNPSVPPPPAFQKALLDVVNEDRPGSHGYMPNAGWPEVRQAVADFLTEEQGKNLTKPFTQNEIVMTVGAGGALNVIIKAVADPGDEILTPRPYFLEYGNYADNHGVTLASVPSKPDFGLDLEAIEKQLGPQTRIMLINSPHNPTGVIYSAEELKKLGKILERASVKFGRPIILLSDEPYRKLAYDGVEVPPVFPAYKYSVVGTSYSKDLSLAGERIGYVAVNPDMPGGDKLFTALTLANRVLGYVNAPSLQQLVLARLQGVSVDVNLYKRRRDLFVEGLKKIGYELTVPQGAFYLFPKSPIADDAAFADMLKEERILAVPGSGFMQPGYFRLCYCVTEESISNSMPGFARAFEKCRQA